MSQLDDKLLELGIQPMEGEDFVPASEVEIREIEERIGESLPKSYRQFLKTYGSSLFEDDVYYFDPELGKSVLFGYFLGLDEILDAMESYEETIPKSMIPICDDGGGNICCLGVVGADRNKVYFHNHSVGWYDNAQKYLEAGENLPSNIQYQTVDLVSDSFENFIISLHKQNE